ncbi:MAG: CoA-binding protein [Treponemataceae bacterium]|nr:CoA-binding protein [Treponemataceae bacterium]
MEKMSNAARRRLVFLANFLSRYENDRVTSKAIQEATGFSSDVVRKDFSRLGLGGGFSNGYDAKKLLGAIRAELGLPQTERRCCIAGLGTLGEAVMRCGIFDGTLYKIVAGFDFRVNRTEVLNADFPLYPANKIESVVSRMEIEFAVLAVENEYARAMAERLIKSGVRGIVNFTNEAIAESENVFVENVSLVLALDNLCARMK